ncbi:MAG: glutamate racemase [Anaerovoracaceae bacterium]
MDTYDNRPIGVFDSGLGGLTAVTCMADILPRERFVYFGDTARTPYGSKSIETIREFSAQITDFLVECDTKIIVIACNTVSATCLEFIKKRYPDIPIIGMIEPTARNLASNYETDAKVGIIGTKVTVESRQYEKTISGFGGKFDVMTKACPMFVPVIEEGIREFSILEPIIRYYLDDFVTENRLDNLVLGCTHYPLIEDEIRRTYPKLHIINPSRIVAQEVKEYLSDNNMLASESNGKSYFYASDLSDEFFEMTNLILKGKDIHVELKDLNMGRK